MSTPNNNGLHSLATLIKRLEAAASRFEDIVEIIEHPSGSLPAVSNRGQASTDRASDSYTSAAPSAPGPPPPPPPPPASVPTPPAAPVPAAAIAPQVAAFQERIIDGKLKTFVEFTKSFAAPSVIDTVALFQKELEALGSFLKIVAACKQPDQAALQSLITPLTASVEAVSRAKEANRRERDWLSHLTVLSEGASIIFWVGNSPPIPYMTGVRESVDYYGNRVKKEFKDKDPRHIEWVNLYSDVLLEQQAYVKEYYTTGLVWNAKGATVAEFQSSSKAATAGPPPPPPPPPTAAPAAPAGGAAAVFAQLNRGEEVTKGLRKVDKSEMTHKNPNLRASSVVPASTSSAPAAKKPIKPSKPSILAGKKPAKLALDGNKWMIEYQENETVTVDNVEISQSVNIFNCKGATILINGKVNAVNILNSTKTSVLVQSVVSSVSVTASPSFQLQVTGKAPMIQLDSTDSGQIYLSKDSLDAEITTAKCSAINISLPVAGEEDGIFEEQAVPEMFKTVVKDGKLVTTVVEHSG